MKDDRSVSCPIIWRRDWTPWLFSFGTTRPAGLDFTPGQFVRIAMPTTDGEPVWRAYSIASSPAAEELEFYSIVVPDGPFTQPLSRSRVGDRVLVDPTVYGFLRTDRFTAARHLWLLATGTGIAPFLSMLADEAVWRRFERIVVVHSVRRPVELAYRDLLETRAARAPFDGCRLDYRPTLTAEHEIGSLEGRITDLLVDGRLERSVGIDLSPDDSRLMLCGNPSMIKQMRVLLGASGFAPVRRDTPGHYISENFW